MEDDLNLRRKFVSDIPREARLHEGTQAVLSPSTSRIQYILSAEDYPLGTKASRPNFKACDNLVIVDAMRDRMKRRLQRIDPREDMGEEEIREYWRRKDAIARGSHEEEYPVFLHAWMEKGSSNKLASSRQTPDSNTEEKRDINLPSIYPGALDDYIFQDLDDAKPKYSRRKNKGDKKEIESVAPPMKGRMGSRRKTVKALYDSADSPTGLFSNDGRSLEKLSHVLSEETMRNLILADETKMKKAFCHRRSWTYIMTMAMERIRIRQGHSMDVTAVPTNAQMRWRVLTLNMAKMDVDISPNAVRKLENIVAQSYAKKDLYALSRKGDKAFFWYDARWNEQENDKLFENFREEDIRSSKKRFPPQEEWSQSDIVDKKSSVSDSATRKSSRRKLHPKVLREVGGSVSASRRGSKDVKDDDEQDVVKRSETVLKSKKRASVMKKISSVQTHPELFRKESMSITSHHIKDHKRMTSQHERAQFKSRHYIQTHASRTQRSDESLQSPSELKIPHVSSSGNLKNNAELSHRSPRTRDPPKADFRHVLKPITPIAEDERTDRVTAAELQTWLKNQTEKTAKRKKTSVIVEEEKTDLLTAGELESWLKDQTEKSTKRKKTDDLHSSVLKDALPDILPTPNLTDSFSTSTGGMDDLGSSIELEDITLERLLSMPEAEFQAALHTITLVKNDKPSVPTIDGFLDRKTVMGAPQQPFPEPGPGGFWNMDSIFERMSPDLRAQERRDMLGTIASRESLSASEYGKDEAAPRRKPTYADEAEKIKDDQNEEYALLQENNKRDLRMRQLREDTETPFKDMAITQQRRRVEPENQLNGLAISHQKGQDANLKDLQIKQQKKSLLTQQEEIISKYNEIVRKQEELAHVQQTDIENREKYLLTQEKSLPAEQADASQEQKAHLVSRQKAIELAQKKKEIVRQRELILMKQKQLDMQYKELLMKQTELLSNPQRNKNTQRQDRLLTRQKEIIARQMELLLQQQRELDAQYNDLISQEYDLDTLDTDDEIETKDSIRQAMELISQELARRNEMAGKGRAESKHDLKKMSSATSGVDLIAKHRELLDKKKHGLSGEKEDLVTTQKDLLDSRIKGPDSKKEDLVTTQKELSDSQRKSLDVQKEDLVKTVKEISDSQKKSMGSQKEDLATAQKEISDSQRKSLDSQKEDLVKTVKEISDSQKKSMKSQKEGLATAQKEISDSQRKSLDSQKEDLVKTVKEISDSQKKSMGSQKEDLATAQKEISDSQRKSLDSQKEDLVKTVKEISDSKKKSMGSQKEDLATAQKEISDSQRKSLDSQKEDLVKTVKEISDSQKKSMDSKKEDLATTQNEMLDSQRRGLDSQKEDLITTQNELLESSKKSLDSQKGDVVTPKKKISDSPKKSLDSQKEDHVTTQKEISDYPKKSIDSQKEDHVTTQKEISDSQKKSMDGQKEDIVTTRKELSDSPKKSIDGQKDLLTTQEDLQESQKKAQVANVEDLVTKQMELQETAKKAQNGQKEDGVTTQKEVSESKKKTVDKKEEDRVSTEQQDPLLKREEEQVNFQQKDRASIQTEYLAQSRKDQGQKPIDSSLRQRQDTLRDEETLTREKRDLDQQLEEHLAELQKEIKLTQQIDELNAQKELLLKQQHELDLQYKQLTKAEIELSTSLQLQSSRDPLIDQGRQIFQDAKGRELTAQLQAETTVQGKRKKKRKVVSDGQEKDETSRRTYAGTGARGRFPKPAAGIKYKPGENLMERFQLDPRVMQAREKNLLMPIEPRYDFEGWDLQAPFTELRYLKPVTLYPKPVTLLQTTQGLLELLDTKKTHSEMVFAAESVNRSPSPRQEGFEYAEKFGLDELFEFMLFNLIHAKPSKPLDFLIDMTREITALMKIRFQASLRLDQPSVSKASQEESERSESTGDSSIAESGGSSQSSIDAKSED